MTRDRPTGEPVLSAVPEPAATSGSRGGISGAPVSTTTSSHPGAHALRPVFDATVHAESDRNVLVLNGELDRASEPHFRAAHHFLAFDHREIVIDCAGITFIDSGGLRLLLTALDRCPGDRLTNVPAPVARLLRVIGRSDVLENRVLLAVAIAVYPGVDVECAARVKEVFELARSEGCSYELVTMPFDPTTAFGEPAERPWRCLVVPPIDAWLGLSETTPVVRWLQRLTMASEQLIGRGERHVPPRGRWLPRRSSSGRVVTGRQSRRGRGGSDRHEGELDDRRSRRNGERR